MWRDRQRRRRRRRERKWSRRAVSCSPAVSRAAAPAAGGSPRGTPTPPPQAQPGAVGAACSAGVGPERRVGAWWWRWLGSAALGRHVHGWEEGCLSPALPRPAKRRPHPSPSRCPFSNRCTPDTLLPPPLPPAAPISAKGHTLPCRFIPCKRRDAKCSGHSRSLRRRTEEERGGSGRGSPALPPSFPPSPPEGAAGRPARGMRGGRGRGAAPRKELNLRCRSPRSARERGGMAARLPRSRPLPGAGGLGWTGLDRAGRGALRRAVPGNSFPLAGRERGKGFC